ncbi:MAG: hypothetical protein ACI4KM_05600 [Oscillospiraceae bacterium]
MKIGKYPVKHTYKIPRMIADVFSVALLILIISGTVSFFRSYAALIAHINTFNGEAAEILAQNFDQSLGWRFGLALIFPVLGAGVITAYIILVLKSHKFSGYNVTKLTAQKYYDLYSFCASLCKIPALLGIFDMMYITDQYLLGNNEISFFSVQVLCDILLIIIIVRFGIHRARSYEQAAEQAAPPDSEKVTIRAVKKDKSENKGTEE